MPCMGSSAPLAPATISRGVAGMGAPSCSSSTTTNTLASPKPNALISTAHGPTPAFPAGVDCVRHVAAVTFGTPGDMGAPSMLSRMRLMKLRRRVLAALALLAFTGAAVAQSKSEVMVSLGRGADDADIDIVRLAYRRILPSNGRWWVPTLVELGGGIWRVPDLAGTTQRFDLHATPIWRADFARTYLEAGIGAYMLSHVINNDTTHMSTSFEFGSHVGAGLRLGERRDIRVGVALQHLSNA